MELEIALLGVFFSSPAFPSYFMLIYVDFSTIWGFVFHIDFASISRTLSVRSSIFSFLLIFLKNRKCAYGLSAVHIST